MRVMSSSVSPARKRRSWKESEQLTGEDVLPDLRVPCRGIVRRCRGSNRLAKSFAIMNDKG